MLTTNHKPGGRRLLASGRAGGSQVVEMQPLATLPVLDYRTLYTGIKLTEIIALKGDDDAAETVSVVLSQLTFPPNLAPNLGADWKAIVEYGTGGVQEQFVCDIGRGTRFSLSCSYLRISAVGFGVAGAPGRVGAFVSYGPQPAMRPPMYSTTMGALAIATASSAIIIPPHASRHYVRRTLPTASFTCAYSSITGAAVMFQEFVGANQTMDPVELTGHVDSVVVTTGAVAFTQWASVFELNI